MVDIYERKVEISIGVFLLIGISAWLFIPVAFPVDTTIFLHGPTNGTGGNQTLALDDLTDVVIISPITGNVFVFNGTFWVNVAQIPLSALPPHAPTHAGLGSDPILTLGAHNLTGTLNANGQTIDNVGVLIDNSAIPSASGTIRLGNDESIAWRNQADNGDNFIRFTDSSGADGFQLFMGGLTEFFLSPAALTFPSTAKDIANVNDIIFDSQVSGTPKELQVSANEFRTTLLTDVEGRFISRESLELITNNELAPSVISGQTTLAPADPAADFLLIYDTSAGALRKVLPSQLGISGETTVCANAGTGNFIHKSGTNCTANSLIAGTGITITNTTDDYTFASQCANTGTGEAICESANNINSAIAGTGITITDTTGDLTYASQCANTGTGEAICESSNNINSLIGTGGIIITDTTGDLTINSRWELLCETTLGSSATSISCSGFTAKEHIYSVLNYITTTSTMVMGVQFNGDTGANYASRNSQNGAADGAITGANQCQPKGNNAIASGAIGNIINTIDNNEAANRKVAYGHGTDDSNTGAATAPIRTESSCKWVNTSAQITTITYMRVSGTGVYNTNTELQVWGSN